MFSHGYEAFTADKSLRKVEPIELSEVASSEVDTLGTHNFIFTKDKGILSKIVFM